LRGGWILKITTLSGNLQTISKSKNRFGKNPKETTSIKFSFFHFSRKFVKE
jgi:hypothetical protein